MTDQTSSSAPSINGLRIDLRQSLEQSTIDPRALSPFQRILLVTDGTVTEILEAYLSESVRIVKLFQDLVEIKTEIPYLEIGVGTRALLRKILLRGKYSHKNYIYAESIILPDRLSDGFREELLAAQKPLGQLMLEAKLETRREILTCRMERAEELGSFFNLQNGQMLISRTYKVIADRMPIMLITEKFPENYFKD